MNTWDIEEFLRASGWNELPAWNRDGIHPMWVLTDELLDFICYGEEDKRNRRFRGGHLHGALENGNGKKRHTEFPKGWTPNTVREAYYHVIRNEPNSEGKNLRFKGLYRGVEIEIAWSFSMFSSENPRVYMFPIQGRGVRVWKNGKLLKSGQKRRK